MKYVKLGPKASIFYDAGTGIKILKGTIVSLTEGQTRSPKISQALRGGHLAYTAEPKNVTEKANQVYPITSTEKEEKEVKKDLRTRYEEFMTQNKTADNIAKAFSIDELKNLAESLEITLEKGDTKVTISEAIFEELSEAE